MMATDIPSPHGRPRPENKFYKGLAIGLAMASPFWAGVVYLLTRK